MDRYDVVIVGAGAAGESAAYEARELGASTAVIERDLFGGGCPFWQCMPSKALLHAAAVHRDGGDFPWPRASAFRDWMIVREGIDYPDDSRHERGLREAGAVPIRGRARFSGADPLRLEVQRDGDAPRELEAGSVILAVGSHSRIPSLPGWWTPVIGPIARGRACGSYPTVLSSSAAARAAWSWARCMPATACR